MIELDPLFGLPAEMLNEFFKMGGMGYFEVRNYDCEEDGHIINVEGSVEGTHPETEERIFAEFTMKVYSSGTFVAIRVDQKKYQLDEESLSQKEETVIKESELKYKSGSCECVFTQTDQEDIVLRKLRFVDGEQVEDLTPKPEGEDGDSGDSEEWS